MNIGIDASNIRYGGGVTHLIELLRAADPQSAGIDNVILFSNRNIHSLVEERRWLKKIHCESLDGMLIKRFQWQVAYLDRLAKANRLDALFIPGGLYFGSFKPFITMSRNLLPFEIQERRQYGISMMRLKLFLLRKLQMRTFNNANGLIFLTKYAKKTVCLARGTSFKNSTIIPHGVSLNFFMMPRKQLALSMSRRTLPLKALYVSALSYYKHQDSVARAVAELVNLGYSIQLDFVGPAYAPAKTRYCNIFNGLDPKGEFLHYYGAVPFNELPENYHNTDIFIFASSCENMPNILLEAMAAGLPIACSNRGPMPEMLGEAGEYFDPAKPKEIVEALKILIDNPEYRMRLAWAAYNRSKEFTWERCARDTFNYIAELAREFPETSEKRALQGVV